MNPQEPCQLVQGDESLTVWLERGWTDELGIRHITVVVEPA